MQRKLVHSAAGERIYVAVLESGDEVSECLSQLAEEESLSGAQITAIGAFRDAVLAFFDWETKAYAEILVSEQVEVLSLNGDIASMSTVDQSFTFIQSWAPRWLDDRRAFDGPRSADAGGDDHRDARIPPPRSRSTQRLALIRLDESLV